jgi:hypothetical protein
VVVADGMGGCQGEIARSVRLFIERFNRRPNRR